MITKTLTLIGTFLLGTLVFWSPLALRAPIAFALLYFMAIAAVGLGTLLAAAIAVAQHLRSQDQEHTPGAFASLRVGLSSILTKARDSVIPSGNAASENPSSDPSPPVDPKPGNTTARFAVPATVLIVLPFWLPVFVGVTIITSIIDAVTPSQS